MTAPGLPGRWTARHRTSAQAGNQAEQAICAGGTLSNLDQQLNSEYNLAVKNMTSAANGGPAADVVRFRQEQKGWLRKRDQCGAGAGDENTAAA